MEDCGRNIVDILSRLVDLFKLELLRFIRGWIVLFCEEEEDRPNSVNFLREDDIELVLKTDLSSPLTSLDEPFSCPVLSIVLTANS